MQFAVKVRKGRVTLWGEYKDFCFESVTREYYPSLHEK